MLVSIILGHHHTKFLISGYENALFFTFAFLFLAFLSLGTFVKVGVKKDGIKKV